MTGYLLVATCGFFFDLFYTFWDRAVHRKQRTRAACMSFLISVCAITSLAVALKDQQNIVLYTLIYSVSHAAGTWMAMWWDDRRNQ